MIDILADNTPSIAWDDPILTGDTKMLRHDARNLLDEHTTDNVVQERARCQSAQEDGWKSAGSRCSAML